MLRDTLRSFRRSLGVPAPRSVRRRVRPLIAAFERLEDRALLSGVAPTLTVTPSPITTAEDTPVTITATPSDPQGDVVTVSILGTVLTDGSVGVFGGKVKKGTGDGYTFTPTPNFHGTASFTLSASDGTNVTDTVVSVNVTSVNDPPLVPNFGYSLGTMTEDGSMRYLSGTAVPPAHDSDGDLISYTVAPGRGPAHGTVEITNPTAANGYTVGIGYKPNRDYHGSDVFGLIASDGKTSVEFPKSYSVTVNPDGVAPAAAADALAVAEDGTLTATVASLLANDRELHATDPQFTIVSGPAHGSLAMVGGVVTYTPSANYNGTDSFSYRVKGDPNTAATSTAVVTIAVASVNDVPNVTTVVAPVTASEDAAGIVVPLAAVFGDADIATNGDSLTLSVAGNTNAGLIAAELVGGELSLTFVANANGSATVTVRATDVAGAFIEMTLLVTVDPVNDAPVIATAPADLSRTTDEDTPLDGLIAAFDTADKDTLWFLIADGDGPAHGGVSLDPNTGDYVYTPGTNFHGTDEFTVTVSDGHGGTATATVKVTVNPVNDAPDVSPVTAETSEDASAAIAPVVTDVEGDPLTWSVVVKPEHGTVVLNGDGTFTYTPNANFNGTDSFTYKANDGTADSSEAVVNLTVTAVNDAPTTSGLALSTPAGISAAGIVPAEDVDGDALSYSLVSGPAAGTVELNPSGSAPGTFVYTPAADFVGTDSFTVLIEDGHGGSVLATITVSVVQTAVEVSIDVLGIGSQDVILARQRYVPVVIFSTSTLDARQIAIPSLTFGHTGDEPSLATPGRNTLAFYRDMNRDGRLDLVVFFVISETGLPDGSSTARLEGELLDGTQIFGTEIVTVLS